MNVLEVGLRLQGVQEQVDPFYFCLQQCGHVELFFFFDGYVVMLIMMLKLDECGILEYFLVYSRTRLTHLKFKSLIVWI